MEIMKAKEKISFFVALILFVLVLILCNYIETTDIKKATVTKVENEIVTLIDEDGEEWQVAFDNFLVGDNVEITINNNHSDKDFSDDKITKINKIK